MLKGFLCMSINSLQVNNSEKKNRGILNETIKNAG